MKITKGTLVRTVMVFLVLVHALLKRFGVQLVPMEESAVTQVVEAVVTLLTVLSAWWYNNSFSAKAREADAFFKQLKEAEDV